MEAIGEMSSLRLFKFTLLSIGTTPDRIRWRRRHGGIRHVRSISANSKMLPVLSLNDTDNYDQAQQQGSCLSKDSGYWGTRFL
ncbi:hypothetical protein MJO28_001963 [Puccinia striiformis f. sp. tritici]|uniref:Uncharacterized protein n=1 Tax=Puccinia striiformis f. sp. tritici TaxID=168172 RepID=A0ACC0EXH0_9BASI|nr:hypothetical protein MJO28_001963 [Puccinia striiformis f. sp. tritici]